jgi:peptidoglycan/LPS O-acetylase OafA/YrhL
MSGIALSPMSSESTRSSIGHIKSLDGIRAVAVLLVLYSHAINHPHVVVPVIHGTVLDDMLRGVGRYGVLMFFVLSGYLITTLLLHERQQHGAIDLPRFWYRRAFRILPVAAVFLMVVGILTYLRVLDIHPGAFAAAATYSWNYQFLFLDWKAQGSDTDMLGHLWSLSVEEQFYLLFPIIMWLSTPKNALRICLVLIVLTPAIRLAQYELFPAVRNFGTIMGHTMFGVSIAIGCAWALSEHLHIADTFRCRLSTSIPFCVAMIYGFVINPFLEVKFHGVWALPIGETLAGFSAAIIMAYLVRYADSSRVARFLNLRWVAWFGTISYSVYIWQQLPYHFDIPNCPLLLSRFLMMIAAILIATTSYYVVESPLLRLRQRIDQRRSPKVNALPAVNLAPQLGDLG